MPFYEPNPIDYDHDAWLLYSGNPLEEPFCEECGLDPLDCKCSEREPEEDYKE